MFRTRIVSSLLILLLFVSAAPVLAGKVLDGIVERGEIRVGMTGSQPPLNVMSKSGTLIGYEVDLVEILADSMGVKAKLVILPFPELLPALKKGDIDMVVSGMTITPERNTQVAFVGPYLLTGKSILTKSETLAAVADVTEIDMESVRLTALAGSTSQEFAEVVIPKAKLQTTDDYDKAIKLVMDGQADAMIADMEICQLTVMRYPDSGLATLTDPLTIEPIGIALPPGDALLINLVENYLSALDMVGLLEELQDAWYTDGSWLIQLP
jgi:polar amino acid transport system substrate-binding protein